MRITRKLGGRVRRSNVRSATRTRLNSALMAAKAAELEALDALADLPNDARAGVRRFHERALARARTRIARLEVMLRTLRSP
jgi:hypothetical protein